MPALGGLLRDISLLNLRFFLDKPRDIRSSQQFRHECDELFEKYGPRLWPSPPADTSGWLVDANVNDLEGLYPVNLKYQSQVDRFM